MNATITKFGYPATLIAQTDHWAVLLRPAQPTLGALIVAAKSEATAFGALPATFHADLAEVTWRVETLLADVIDPQRINWLMLMMVDPHVHFHVLPRYEGTRSLAGLTIADAGWPALPRLNDAITPDAIRQQALIEPFRAAWPIDR